MITPDKINQLSILIVEDEKIAQITIMAIFRRLGCKFDLAENGSQALEKFNANNYNLVLMDIGLPDMRGTQVTAEIRRNEKNIRTPIVALTGYAKSEVQTECDAAGMDAIYNKPLVGDDLQQVILQHAK